jgi:hypothetical protein
VRRALALLLLALPLVACSGTRAVTSLDPLARAADRTTSAPGAHFAITGHVVTAGRRVSFAGSGELGDHGRTVHLRLSAPMAGKVAGVEVVESEGSIYLRGGPVAQLAGGKWLRVKGDPSGLDLAREDPSRLLQDLERTSKITRIGTDSVRGEPTTHFRARIQRQGLRNTPIDVWIGGDGLVRRIALDVKRPEGALAASVELFDFGNVSITVPDDADTMDLGQLGGG